MSNYCVDCKYYREPLAMTTEHLCLHPRCRSSEINPITGEQLEWKAYCHMVRNKLCQNGKLFEPKPEPVTLFGKLKGLFYAKEV
jgi:hypothetical protein